MLRGLVVGGVKAFELRHEVLLAPLTLIFGANSAGKSTLLHSLLLLQQSVQDGSWDDPQLLPRGQAVDMGSYRNLVSGHDDRTCVTLGLSASLDAAGRSPLTVGVEATVGLKGGRPRLMRTDITWADDPLSAPRRIVFDVIRDPRDDAPPVFILRSDWMVPPVRDWLIDVLGGPLGSGPWIQAREHARGTADAVEKDAVELACSGLAQEFAIDPERGAKATATGWVPRHWRGRTADLGGAEAFVIGELEWLLACADGVLRRELEGVRSVGPLRLPLPRVDIASRGSHRQVRDKGEQLLESLVDDEGLRAEVNHWLGRLNVGYVIDPVDVSTGATVERTGGGDEVLGDVIGVRFIEDGTDLPVSPSDVGHGVVQVVPVVIECLAQTGGTLLVEQPELHLHPRLQAELGELFAARAPHKTFILETHSEHLILRLARLVKLDGALAPEQIRILVVGATQPDDVGIDDGLGGGTTSHSRTVVHEVELDERGRFVTPWPGGFFPERERELFAADVLDPEEMAS